MLGFNKFMHRTKVSLLSLLLMITNITFLPMNVSANDEEIEPYSLTGDVGSLALVRNDDGVDIDMEDGTLVPMSISRNNKYTFNVKAEFNAGDEKKINIYVPTGYKIVSYSATESTPDIEEVQKINIDNTYKPFVDSSVLTAATTGSMTSQVEKYGTKWSSQRIHGYYKSYSRTEAPIHTYGGDIEYTFNKNTTKVELVFELRLQQHILPHLTVNDDVFEPVKVVMSSKNQAGETNELSTTFNGVAKNNTSLQLKYSGLMGGAAQFNVGADKNNPQKLSDSIPIIWDNVIYNGNASEERNYFSDEVTYTIEYPEGVYFDDHMLIRQLYLFNQVNGDLEPLFINDEKLITQDNVTYTSLDGKYCNFKTEDKTECHFEVQIDENEEVGGGKIVLTFYKVGIQHQLENGVYFRADLNKYTPSNPKISGFKVTSQATRNGLANTPSTVSYERTLSYYDGTHKEIDIRPTNSHRKDFDRFHDGYNYDYALGGFEIEPKFSYPNNNVVLDFDTEKIGVRGVSVAGFNIKNIEATTTMGRTIKIPYVSEYSSSNHGVMISPEELGLMEGEYLDIFKATVDLKQVRYSNFYTDSGFGYFGKLLDTTEGEKINSASIQFVDDNGNIVTNSKGQQLFANDTIEVHWNNTGVLNVESSVKNENENSSGNVTAYPNQILSFESTVKPGETWRTGAEFNYDSIDADSIVDPVAVISLPYGISLDRESVKAVSVSGNYKGAEFPLKQIGEVEYVTKNGVRWSVYKFTALDELDMVARERTYWSFSDQRQLEYAETGITLKFNTVVDPYAPLLNLDVRDIIKWDLNKTAYNANGIGNYIGRDWHNELGHGTDYYFARNSELKFSIKPLTGLLVELGIKEKDSANDFQNFNGTDDSIVKVGFDKNAQVKLSYHANTSTNFSAGTTLYLPIPKKGMDYTKYFENIELDKPLDNTINKTFKFTTVLNSVPELTAEDNNGTTWTTYYATGTLKSNDTDYVAGDEHWEPVTDENNGEVIWTKADEYTGNLKDVVMLKFVADTPIVSNGTGQCILDLKLSGDEDENVPLDELADYWRTYNKILDQNDAKTGIWSYSNPIAVTPDYHAFLGIFFIDKDRNGNFDFGIRGGVDEFYNPDNPVEEMQDNIVASYKTGDMIAEYPLAFTDLDGQKVILLDRLKTGTYEIILRKNDSAISYSKHNGKNPSSSIQINNDLRDIDDDDIVASYKFTITDDQRDYYAGFGLEEKVNVSYEVVGDLFPENSSELPADELLEYGTEYDQKDQLTTTNPSFTFLGWYIDEECTRPYVDGTSIVEDTVLYGKWSTTQVRVDYVIIGEKPDDANAPDGVTLDYGEKYNQESKPFTKNESYEFFGWYTDEDCTNPYTDGTSIIEDTTLYGKYVKKQVKVSYEITGTVRPSEFNKPTTDIINYGDDYRVSGPATTSEERFTFHGWYLTKDCTGNRVTDLNDVTKDTILYGYWTKNPVHVSYEVVGDIHPKVYKVPDSEELENGTPYTQKGEPETDEKGYVFDGWYTDEDCTKPFINETAIFNDITLYGKYTIQQLKVNYHVIGDVLPKDGTTNPYPQEKFSYNKVYKVKDSLTTTDTDSGVQYYFNGWYDNPELTGTCYTSSTLTQDLDLYGEWIKLVNVEYVWVSTDNPTDVRIPSSVQNLLAGVEYKSTTQEKSNQPYTFDGWFTDEACTQKYADNTKLEKNLVLYGKWTKNQVKVSYEVIDNGTRPNNYSIPDGSTFDYGKSYVVSGPSTTKEAGFIFDGWYLTEDCTGTKVTNIKSVTEDTVLYGKYTKGQVNVSYEVVGNVKPDNSSELPEKETFDYGTAYDQKDKLTTTDKGYTFSGWFTDKECTKPYVDGTSIVEDTVLYGKWTKNPVNVSYKVVGTDKPGNYTTPDGLILDYGNSYTVEGPSTTTEAGWIFDGWYLTEDCTGTKVTNIESVTENTVLYGKYSKEQVNVSYEVVGDVKPDNSSELPEKEIFDYGTAYDQKDKLTTTDKGYTFSGWFTDKECTKPYVDGTSIVEDTVLYGKWMKDKVNVTYVVVGDVKPDNSSELPSQKEFDFGTIYNQENPLTTTSKGYTFKGWYIDKECTKPYADGTALEDNLVLYGYWVKEKVNVSYVVVGDVRPDNSSEVPGKETLDYGTVYNQKDGLTTTSKGYTFKGWYIDMECKVPYVAGELTSDLVLYGKWDRDRVNITYEVLGDKPNDYTTPDNDEIYFGDAYDQAGPSTSKDDSYVFEGWFTDKECTKPYVNGTELEEDIILYGKWSKKPTPPLDSGEPEEPENPVVPPVGPEVPDVPQTSTEENSSSYVFFMLLSLAGLMFVRRKEKDCE